MFRNLKHSSLLLDTLTADQSSIQTPRQVFNAHYSLVSPQTHKNPNLILYSSSSAKLLELTAFNKEEAEKALSGNISLFNPPQKTWSLAYAGHQFGSWAGQLGDGRAISLAQLQTNNNQIWELQLKGSGLTPYSRMGDGFAVLRSSIREFLASEFMFHLGVPTSRALSLVSTDTVVWRESKESGAVVGRLAPSWLRFGNWELLFYRNDVKNLKILTDYTINNFFPDSIGKSYSNWLKEVLKRTAIIIANWQAFGFCHGVMNTDNFSILGLTIDYGPFQFMDIYDPGYICNKSDYSGIYSFERQPLAAQFNIVKFATCLLPLIIEENDGDKQETQSQMTEILESFLPLVNTEYMKLMYKKIGVQIDTQDEKNEYKLIKDLLKAMKTANIDYTIFFRELCFLDFNKDQTTPTIQQFSLINNASTKDYADLLNWIDKTYKIRLSTQNCVDDEKIRLEKMKSVNPKFVLRNHLLQVAIEQAEKGEFGFVERYFEVLKRPFEEGSEKEKWEFGSSVPVEMLGSKCSCSS